MFIRIKNFIIRVDSILSVYIDADGDLLIREREGFKDNYFTKDSLGFEPKEAFNAITEWMTNFYGEEILDINKHSCTNKQIGINCSSDKVLFPGDTFYDEVSERIFVTIDCGDLHIISTDGLCSILKFSCGTRVNHVLLELGSNFKYIGNKKIISIGEWND